MKYLDLIIAAISKWIDDFIANKPHLVVPPVEPYTPPAEVYVFQPPIEPPASLYDWNNPKDARHLARVVMDEYGLKWAEKDLLCACIQQESRFMPKAIGKMNSNGTQDFGLCQYNNGKNPNTGKPYWIGPGAAFSSIEEVLNDPEKNVRVMVQVFLAGNLKLWASYSTGAYKQWL